MWSLTTLDRINRKAAQKSEGKEPYVMDSTDEIDSWPPFPFPQLGYDACSEVELKEVDSLFCDMTGRDHRGFALHYTEVRTRLRDLFDEHGPLAIAIGQVGPYQLNVKVWKAPEAVT